MQKFNELPQDLQELAISNFEKQGIAPNLDLRINETTENGNFDWSKSNEKFKFWLTLFTAGIEAAKEIHDWIKERKEAKAAEKGITPPKPAAKTAKKAAPKKETPKKEPKKTTQKNK